MADWPRACAHFKGSLEAHILLFGKMDGRTIAVAKLLHSARKGRTEGAADKDEGEEGDEDHHSEGGAEEKNGRDAGDVYQASNMISTPRAIEVAANGEVAPAYKSAIDLIETRGSTNKLHK